MSKSVIDALFGGPALADARQDLAKASSLPAPAYTSPAVYQRENERLFSREWLCAGRADQIPEPGDYFSLDLLGDRLVVVRDQQGEIRVLSRVCRHRAAEVVTGAGNARSFQCPYHAWTYRLDGSLVGAPYMDGAEGFDRTKCRLPELRNRDTFEPIFPAARSHSPDSLGPYSLLLMPGNDDRPHEDPIGGLPRAGDLAAEEEGRLVAACVFPFHLFAPGAESLTWYQLLSERFDRFTLRIFSCFPRATLDDPAHQDAVRGLQEFTKLVHHQDIEACETTWRGLRSRSFESGRLCPLEKPIWQFNQWWIERMASGP